MLSIALLDMRTFSLTLTLVSACGALLLFYFWRTRQNSPGFGYWVAFAVAGAVGAILFALRGVIPVPFAILAGNALVGVSYLLGLQGVRRFLGRRRLGPGYWASLGLFLLILVALLYIYPDVNLRIACYSLYTAGLAAMAGGELCRHAPVELRGAARFTAAGLFLTAGLMLARAILTLFVWPSTDFFGPTPPQVLAFSLGVIAVFIISFGFILLNSQRMENVLRQSEARYRTLFEMAREGIWQLDAQARTLLVNPHMAEMLGYTPAEMLGRSLYDFMDEEQQPAARQLFERWQRGVSEQHELRFRRKDGAPLWAIVSATAVVSPQGKFQYAFAMLTDITARKRDEQALRDGTLLLDRSEEIAGMGSFVWNVADDMLVWSRNMYALCGLDPAQPIGNLQKAMAERVHPDDRERINAEIAAMVAAGRVWPMEFRIVRPDGSERLLRSSGEFVYDEEGRPQRCFGVHHDITERRQAEIEIATRARQQEQVAGLGQRALRQPDIGALLHDAAALVAETLAVDYAGVLELNSDGEALTLRAGCGYEPGMVGSLTLPAGQGSQAGYTLLSDAPVIVEDIHTETRFTVPAISHAMGIVSGLSVLIRSAGRPYGVLYAFSRRKRSFTKHDADFLQAVANVLAAAVEHKRTTEALLHSERRLQQQERLAVVGQLAGGIAHDFNNLLTGMLLNAQLALEAPGLPPEAEQDLHSILRSGQRAGQLVRQILDFSRRSPIETRPLELQSFVKEIVKMLGRTLPEKIRLRAQLERGACVVNADPTRIQQALLNLAVNARDAMPDGGELTIGLKKMVLRPDEPAPVAEMPAGQWVCLSVADTGPGLSPLAEAHLFEPFFTTKPVGKGTGLGLAQVHGIVRQHGGYIGLHNAAGQGATFCIYLPAVSVSAEDMLSAPADISAPRGRGETILIVEDEEGVRELGRRILERLGYHVLTAGDGAEGLRVWRDALAAQDPIDLVLSDVVMPNLSGPRLACAIWEQLPEARILLMSGYAEADELRGLGTETLPEIVFKPFDANTLAKAVRQTLDGRL